MRKSIRLIAAVAFTLAIAVAWSYASIRSDVALKTYGQTSIDAQIDLVALTKNTSDLPTQSYAAF